MATDAKITLITPPACTVCALEGTIEAVAEAMEAETAETKEL